MGTSHVWRMGPRGVERPEVLAHSQKKIELLKEYLKQYVEERAGPARNPGAVFRLAVVDAFCGGGVYEDGTDGSALTLLETARRLEKEFRQNWQPRTDKGKANPPRMEINVWLNDRRRENIECLRNELSRRHYVVDGTRLRVTNLAWSTMAPKLREWTQEGKNLAGKAIVLLDQEGFRDVSTAELNQVLEDLPQAEILLTLSAVALLNRRLDDASLWEPGKAGGKIIAPAVREQILQARSEVLREHEAEPVLPEKAEEVLKRFALNSIVEQVQARAWSCFTLQPARGPQSMWIIHIVRNPKASASSFARDTMLEVHSSLDGITCHAAGTPRNFWGYEGLRAEDDRRNVDMFRHEFTPATNEALRRQWGEDVLRDHFDLFDRTGGVSVKMLLDLTENMSGLTRKARRTALVELVRRQRGAIQVWSAVGRRSKDWQTGRLAMRDGDHLVWMSQFRVAIQGTLFG